MDVPEFRAVVLGQLGESRLDVAILRVGIEFTVCVRAQFAETMETELRQALDDLDLKDQVRVERAQPPPATLPPAPPSP